VNSEFMVFKKFEFVCFWNRPKSEIFEFIGFQSAEKWSLNSAAQVHLDSRTLPQDNLMTKRRLSATSISSELDTVESLRAKLAKAEAKKAAKKPKSQPRKSCSKVQHGDASEDEENQVPGGKHIVLVK
jgi:hypothetical protein